MDKKRLEAHMNDGKTEYVMCAAIHVDDGESYSYQPYNIDTGIVLCGWRHPGIFQQAALLKMPDSSKAIQGFLTTKNRFLTRKEAYALVKETGQLKQPLIGCLLYTSDAADE